MSILVRLAQESDIIIMEQLLEKARLNTIGIKENLENFLVVEDLRTEDIPCIVGMVGLEIYDDKGIMRSLVMKSENWNSKVGLELVELVIAYGWRKGLREIYLMTTNSRSFFGYWGFTEIEWSELPEQLQNSSQFLEYDHRYVALMRLTKNSL